MSFLDVMQTYFRGEKIESLYFIVPLGLVLLAFGFVALRAERAGFAWGIAVPCFVFGLVLVGAGLSVGIRTNGQVAALHKEFKQAPADMVKKELPRMKKVGSLFRTTFYSFGVLALVGLILTYAVRAGWSRGLGAVLILVGALGLLVDGFAERRAVTYTDALVELASKHDVAPKE